jgi:hypothetical protein
MAMVGIGGAILLLTWAAGRATGNYLGADEMIRTFQGHFHEGRFVSPQPVAIPEYVEVFIVVTDKPISVANPQQRASEDIARSTVGTESVTDVIDKTVRQRNGTGHNPRVLREPDPSKSTMLGAWNGEVIIPDDFDEPLEEMKEYMV